MKIVAAASDRVRAPLTRLRVGASTRDTARHDYAHVFLKVESRLTSLLLPLTQDCWSILDLGCGYHSPQVALFTGRVAACCGFDVERVFIRDGRRALFRDRRQSVGVARAAKWALVRYPWYRAYCEALAEEAGRVLPWESLDISTYDGIHLPLAAGSFDAVISNAVLEHIRDLDSLAHETSRVLRPGGVVDMVWHNFYSLSGAHVDPSATRARPWGHLLGGESARDLNRETPDVIEHAFARYLRVLRVVPVDICSREPHDPEYLPEGENLLDSELRQRLGAYSETLLTSRAFLIQCRKESGDRATPELSIDAHPTT